MRVNNDTKSVDLEQRDFNYILPAYIISYLFVSNNEDPEKIVFPMYPSVPHPRKPGVLIPIEYVAADSPVAVDIIEDSSNVAEATEEQVRQIDEKEDEIKKLKEEVAELRGEESGEPISAEELAKIPNPLDTISVDKHDGVTIEPAAHIEYSADMNLASEEVSPARAAFAEAKEEPKATVEVTSTTMPVYPDRVPKQPPGGALPPGTPLDGMQSRDVGFERKIAQDLAPQPDVNEEEEVATEIKKPKEE